MGKFSLFDFLSFILPGGTFIGCLYIMLKLAFPGLSNFDIPKSELFIIPFLVISYTLGHIFSVLGKKIERITPGLKAPWMVHLKNRPKEAKQINQEITKLFNIDSFIGKNKEIKEKESNIAYDKIYDYLEIQEKDSKIKILMAQFGFFRNTAPIWLLLLITIGCLLVLKGLHIIELNATIGYYIASVIIFLFLLVSSVLLMKQRLLLAMKYVYRTFLAINIKTKK